MIYLTGDIHGEVYRIADAANQYGITPRDTVVLLGDVGMNYFGNNHGDRHRKKRRNKIGTTMFCIGNHEIRPETILTYHEVQWHGGLVYVEDAFPNLLFAKDRAVYDLVGGAYSVDKWYRLQCDWNWFPDEQPSDEIKARVKRKLEKLGWQVDIALTHT